MTNFQDLREVLAGRRFCLYGEIEDLDWEATKTEVERAIALAKGELDS